jgi:cytochrome P450
VALASELNLPLLDFTDAETRGERYQAAMTAVRGHDDWLAAQPFGFVTLDRESGEFFLRSRAAEFPGMTIAQMFEITEGPLHEEITKNIITINGGDHARLRSLVGPALAPRRVDQYRPAMRGFAEALLDGTGPAATDMSRHARPVPEPTVEFIADFAKPYPAQVIAHVMGAPVADAPYLHKWSNVIQRQFDPPSLLAERPEIEESVAECYAYIDALIDTRRSRPGEDLITDLIAAEEAGDKLGQDELCNLVLNILVGGVDTSQSQLAHAVRLLADAPEQWSALRADPQGLAGAAIEEALRYEPITPFTARILIEEVEFRGVVFPAGTIVMVSAWHANRDGVGGGDSFDITAERDRARVLTFGAGIHYCVGANVARAEMQEAMIVLAEGVSSLRPAGPAEFGTPSGIYGLERLPLVLTFAR